jgi:hypothetical protein
MGDDREFRIKITADASSAVQGAGQTAAGLDKVGQKTEEGGKSSEHAEVSHRALHLVFGQIGQASKGLEVGLMAVSGVMMGSLSFGVYAAAAAVRMLIGHFEKQKEIALSAAKATVQFWTDALQGNADARKAADDYAAALHKIITNVDTLKQTESEEAAVLKNVAQQRLKIIDAERQAEIAAAKGDKEEEARINARFGQHKSDVELQNEQNEIDLKKRHLEEQATDAMKKEQASAAAEKAKEAGAPGRSEATAAEARLPKLTEELATLQAARLKPDDLAALREEVKRRAGESGSFVVPGSGAQESAAGSARRRLRGGEAAEQAYSAAQQEFEQSQADVEGFKSDTAALTKAADDAMGELSKAVETARATSVEIGKSESVHAVNLDAADSIKGIKAGGIIQAGGGHDNPLNRGIVADIWAMEGAGQGQAMSPNQTAMVNHLVAGLRAQGNSQATILKLLTEMKDLHIDADKKFADISASLRQVHGAAPRIY